MDLTRYRARRKVPPALEVAALLTEGITLEEIAEACDARVDSITKALYQAGFSPDGTPVDDDQPRDLGPWALWRPAPWMADALCAQVDPDLWFPEKGGSTREAVDVCRRCPVAAECLAHALDNQERFGIWGGVSERNRRKLSTLTERTAS